MFFKFTAQGNRYTTVASAASRTFTPGCFILRFPCSPSPESCVSSGLRSGCLLPAARWSARRLRGNRGAVMFPGLTSYRDGQRRPLRQLKHVQSSKFSCTFHSPRAWLSESARSTLPEGVFDLIKVRHKGKILQDTILSKKAALHNCRCIKWRAIYWELGSIFTTRLSSLPGQSSSLFEHRNYARGHRFPHRKTKAIKSAQKNIILATKRSSGLAGSQLRWSPVSLVPDECGCCCPRLL